jgi:hypothetical protein
LSALSIVPLPLAVAKASWKSAVRRLTVKPIINQFDRATASIHKATSKMFLRKFLK